MMLSVEKVMARSILEPGYMDANRPRDMASGIEITATIPANLSVFISLGTVSYTHLTLPTILLV